MVTALAVFTLLTVFTLLVMLTLFALLTVFTLLVMLTLFAFLAFLAFFAFLTVQPLFSDFTALGGLLLVCCVLSGRGRNHGKLAGQVSADGEHGDRQREKF